MPTNNTALRLLVVIQLVSMGAMEMSGPFWPLQIQKLLGVANAQYTGLLSSLVYAGPMMAAMILTPMWGRLGDRTGHKLMIIRALLALAVCQALAAITPDPWWLVAIRVVQGALAGFIAAAQAYALASCGDGGRGHILARLQSATAVGSLAGPVLGGWLMDISGFALLCYSATAVCLLCAIISAFLPSDSPRSRPARTPKPAALPKGWIGAMLGIIVLIQAARMMPQPFYALYVAQVLHAPAWLIGASYGASALTLALSAPLWGRLFDRHQPAHTLRIIEWVTWACAFTLACTALASEWVGFYRQPAAVGRVAGCFVARGLHTDRHYRSVTTSRVLPWAWAIAPPKPVRCAAPCWAVSAWGGWAWRTASGWSHSPMPWPP